MGATLKRAILLLAFPLGLVLALSPPSTARREWKAITSPGAAAEYDWVVTEAPNLKRTLRVTGLCLGSLGLAAAAGLYFRMRGIQIASPGVAALWDGIGCGIGAPFLFAAADLALVRFAGTQPSTGEFWRFMGAFWVVVAIPLMALFTTAMTAHAVEVTSEGVATEDLLGRRFLAWSNLVAIHARKMGVAKPAGGAIFPKPILAVLELTGKSTTVRIPSPPTATAREAIRDQLMKHSPERWHDELARAMEIW